MKPEFAIDLLKRTYEADRLAQAYILVGPATAEVEKVAHGILSLLFCLTEEHKACGKCAGCRQVAEHTHPDVLWIEPWSKSRRISIEEVRAIKEFTSKTPLCGEWKACVIVAADRLTDQAANAFLKTLEEPSGRTLFLLLTDNPQRLRPTIRSRCQQLAIEVEAPSVPSLWYERLHEALRMHAGGIWEGFRSGLRIAGILEELKKEAAKAEEEEQQNRRSDAEAVEEQETIEARVSARYRSFRDALMRSILLWYRDILLLQCGAGADLLYHKQAVRELQAIAGRIGLRAALRAIRVVEQMQKQLEENLSEREVLVNGFVQLL